MTNHQFLDKTNKILISGFYEVDQQNIEINKDYDDPVLYAKRAVFINLSDCVDISSLAIGKGLTRFGFSSETNGGTYYNYLLNIKEEIERKSNRLELYKKETVKLDIIFKFFEYEEGIYKICEKCDSLKICPLLKRIKSKKKLYDKLPIKISNIINEHYKSVIDIKGLV